ncbi:group III truncated hemoglobin [Pseudogemmobacter sp. W21_MBD1_M6]|jgi:hemoglobin|uniref:group III truncated hemoglobin n=1 Tax=Pseudogemmobacter sp. W21_MBD1_M6 TaxID=3240271 RepID=UPI003F96ED04
MTASALPPRLPLNATEIDSVVALFYARIRNDAVLGPVFFNAIGDDADIWATHEAKIAAFWRNSILRERSYSGNPMQVHMGVKGIEPEHFDRWLALFSATCADVLPTTKAEGFAGLATRIGAGLKMGVAQSRRAPTDVPILR